MAVTSRPINNILLNRDIENKFKFISFLVILVISFPVLADQDIYILNTSTAAPYKTADRTGFQDLVVSEIFRRIGLNAQVEKYDASARALRNANDNVDQGVAMRIKGLEKQYPNLVRVEEPLIDNDFVAYSKNLNFVTNNWESLKPYIVTYIHGWVIFDRNIGPEQRKHTVKTPSQMFSMLDKNRVDLVLYERWQGLQLAMESGIDVKTHEPPLASVKMYLYMHKNHAHLVPKLSEALHAMKVDGTYQSIYDKTLNNLLEHNKTD